MKAQWSTIFISVLFAITLSGCQLNGGNAAVAAVLATQVSAYTVTDANGNEIGAVDGLVVDRESGAIDYVIVQLSQPSLNGKATTTEPERPVVIPWNELQLDTNTQSLIFTVDTVFLQGAPRLVGSLDTLKDGWDNEIHRYWNPLPER